MIPYTSGHAFWYYGDLFIYLFLNNRICEPNNELYSLAKKKIPEGPHWWEPMI